MYIYINWTQNQIIRAMNWNTANSTSISLNKWDIVSIRGYWRQDWQYWEKYSSKYTITKNYIYADDMPQKKSLVYEEKNLGEKITGYLFGRLPTGEWRNWE